MKKFQMIHHVDQLTIAEMYEKYEPVFILSTGRSGSKFVVELLNLAMGINAFHEPRPTLQYFSNFACHHQHLTETLTQMIDAARMEMVLENFIKGKIFVESNQCLTFFAPFLADLFKKAKFVHLIRHPGDFVASAVRKGWYVNDSIWESGRPKHEVNDIWQQFSLAQKLGWLWNASNGFLRDFTATLGSERVLTCRLEDIVTGADYASGLFTFCAVDAPEKTRIKDMQAKKINPLWIGLHEPPNMRKDPGFPAYKDWSADMKKELWEMVGTAAVAFGYER